MGLHGLLRDSFTLHVLISIDHHVVFEYISVVIELSVKMDQFFTLIFINKHNNIRKRDMLYAEG
jgi:hypothetical protein